MLKIVPSRQSSHIAPGKSRRQSAVEPSLTDDRVGATLDAGTQDAPLELTVAVPHHVPARLGESTYVDGGLKDESVRCGAWCALAGAAGRRCSISKAKGAGGEDGAKAFSRQTSIRRWKGTSAIAAGLDRDPRQHASYRHSTQPASTTTATTASTIDTTGIDELGEAVAADALRGISRLQKDKITHVGLGTATIARASRTAEREGGMADLRPASACAQPDSRRTFREIYDAMGSVWQGRWAIWARLAW